MSRGRTLKLFLVDGTPTGVISAQLGNWSGKAIVGPRTALASLIAREETGRTGVYLLVGPDPEFPTRQRVYIGESDSVRTRLRTHDGDESKDFFTRACVFTSKDENLTKAHVRFLESRLITAVRTAGRARLSNGTDPEFVGLPEDERADMEGFLDQIEVILPVLGFDILQPLTIATVAQAVSTEAPQAEVTFQARIPGENGVVAQGRAAERGGEFVVLEGATALRRETPGIPESVSRRRTELIKQGIFVDASQPQLYQFLQDVSFASPSGASAAMAGRSDNGRTTWKVVPTGQTYADWRSARLENAERAGDAAD